MEPIPSPKTTSQGSASQRTKTLSGKPYILLGSLPFYISSFMMYVYYRILRDYENPYLILWIFMGFYPLLDLILKADLVNPTTEQTKLLEKDFSFRIPLLLHMICEWCFEFWFIGYMSSRPFHLGDFFIHIFLMSSYFSANIPIAHEIFHQEGIWRVIGTLTLSKNLYMHYAIAHTWGHHRNVATPLDSGYARLGESFFEFLPHALIGGFKDGWNYETTRLKALRPDRSVWVSQNRMIWFSLNNIVLPLVVLKVYGWYGMVMFLLLAIKGAIDFEGVNYMQHYGLTRKEISPGVYEKVTAQHSWDASWNFSNLFTYKASRHSDHHVNSYKPYQTLRVFDESPTLPVGYFMMLGLVYDPKTWFAVMDPLAIAYSKGVKLSEEENQKIQGIINRLTRKNFITASLLLLSVIVYRIYFIGV